MRVLWFTNTPCNLKIEGRKKGRNSGGWMTALQDELLQRNDVELGICFIYNGLPEKIDEGGTVYFPVPFFEKSLKDKLKGFLRFSSIKVEEPLWDYYIERFHTIIERFNPDVVHVFGSELYTGLAVFSTTRPLVLHIQGILNTCYNALYAPGLSSRDYILQDFNPLHIWTRYYNDLWWRRDCYRERQIMNHIRHYIGRTEWDKRVSKIFSPNSFYHFGEELMRSPFYTPLHRMVPEKLTINTVISSPLYKGLDLVLKTASVLKNILCQDFVWNVYGNVNPHLIEKTLGLNHHDMNVFLRGVVGAEDICDAHSKATVYVHTSYIENGCNAIIEAQMCGLPVIANDVGGLSTTIKDKDTGFLVPANDPYQTSYLINYLFTHPKENIEIGKRAALDAFARHNKENVVNGLMNTYKEVILSYSSGNNDEENS